MANKTNKNDLSSQEWRRKQKQNNIKTIVILLLFLALLPIYLFIVRSNKTYTREALVIYKNDDFVTAVTLDGNEWDFYTDDEIKVNDEITLTFDVNNTKDNIYDDIIVNAQKIER